MKPKTIWCLLPVLGVFASSVFAAEIGRSPYQPGYSSPIKVNFADGSGKQHNLKLTQAEYSVLHPNIKYITVDRDLETGRRIYDAWTPSEQELQKANNVHVDHENRAVVRVSHDENQIRVLNGIVNGKIVHEKNGIAEFFEIDNNAHLDYVETDVNLTYSHSNNAEASPDYVVETVIVCDKEWGDKFQGDRQQILNYWTIYFWDINMRYKTLQKSNISFRITSIIVIKSIQEQPFIEEARNEEGKAALNVVLGKFASWIWGQKEELPKFDMAVSVLKTPISFSDGIAYVRGTCNQHTGTVVWGDDGSWRSAAIGAHEIGHNLGAPHDGDANYPGGCSYPKGYIMGGGSNYTQYHFSECSDRTIEAYVSSDQGACLKRIDEPSAPVINPDFNAVLAPTMDEQCKSWFGPESVIWKGNSNCLRGWCWRGSTAYAFLPIDNSPCGEEDSGPSGRCFRGQCVANTAYSFLKNVASGKCLLGTDRFSGTDNAEMANCPTVPTPLNQFRTFAVQRGRWIITKYSTREEIPDKDKCLVGNRDEGGLAGFGKCDTTAGNLSEWSLQEVENGEYLFMEATTKRCAKQDGDVVRVYGNCDRNDRAMRWKISLSD